LVDAFNDSHPQVRFKVVIALGEIALEAEAAVQPLARALADSDPWVRYEGARALSKLGPKARSALGALGEMRNDPNLYVRLVAEHAVAAIQGDDRSYLAGGIIERLARGLQGRDWIGRAKAAQTIGLLGRVASGAFPALVKALRDADNRVAYACIEALGSIAKYDQAVAAALMRAVCKDKILSGWAATALEGIPRQAGSRAPDVISLPKQNDYEIRRLVGLALLEMAWTPKEEDIPQLTSVLMTKQSEVRCPDLFSVERLVAATALGHASEESRSIAIAALVHGLQDANCRIRSAAQRSLQRLGSGGDGYGQRSSVEWKNLCPIIHCTQRGTKDCAIAAIAMVSGISYEEVEKRALQLGKRRRMSRTKTLLLLESATRLKWRACVALRRRSLTGLNMSDQIVPVVIRRPWSIRKLHLIVMYKDIVHDPAYDHSFVLREYPRLHWAAQIVYEAKNAPRDR